MPEVLLTHEKKTQNEEGSFKLMSRFYDNLHGFQDLKYEDGVLYGRFAGGSWQAIPTRGENGKDGVNQYLYIAYAADTAGSAFSRIPSPDLKYRAELQSTVEIASPSAALFAGRWVKYLGDDGQDGSDGTDGENGAAGKDVFLYVAYASDASGTAFSLIPSVDLRFRAELHTQTEIQSPTLSDFQNVPFVEIVPDTSEFVMKTQLIIKEL